MRLNFFPDTRSALECAREGDFLPLREVLSRRVGQDLAPDWSRLSDLGEITGNSLSEFLVNADSLNHAGLFEVTEGPAPLGEVVFFARKGGLTALLREWIDANPGLPGVAIQLFMLPEHMTKEIGLTPYLSEAVDLSPLVELAIEHGVWIGTTGLAWISSVSNVMQKTADFVEKGDLSASKAASLGICAWRKENCNFSIRDGETFTTNEVGVLQIQNAWIRAYLGSADRSDMAAQKLFLQACAQGVLEPGAITILCDSGLDLNLLPEPLGSTGAVEAYHAYGLYNKELGSNEQYQRLSWMTINVLTVLLIQRECGAVAILDQVDCPEELKAAILSLWVNFKPDSRDYFSEKQLEHHFSVDIGL
jgi:hypothetical protein